MDELDRIADEAVVEVRAEASRVADTERALADVHLGVRPSAVDMLPARSARRRSWQRPALVGAAAAAGLIVIVLGVTALVRDGGDRVVPAERPVQPDTTPAVASGTTATTEETDSIEEVVPASTTPSTIPSPTTVSEPPPDTTEVAGFVLMHGLRMTSPPGPPGPAREITAVRSVDSFGAVPGPIGVRADAVTELQFADGRAMRITLGRLDEARYRLRTSAPDLGLGGWVADGPGDGAADIGAAAGRQLESDVWVTADGRQVASDTWITVEALLTGELGDTSGSGAAFGLDDVRNVLAGLEYDAVGDSRARSTAAPITGTLEDPCATPTSITGDTVRSLVLFTCDGVLGVYDAATRERTEVIERFDLWANPDPTDEESGYSPFVDAVVVSADGSTVWYTVSTDSPGVAYRYALGSGATPERVADGLVLSASPRGDRLAVATLFGGIALVPTGPDGTSTDVSTLNTFGTFFESGSWSPDGKLLAVVANGAIGLVDTTTGSIVLRGPLEGQAYAQAWFGDDGRLYGLLDDGETLRLALVGDLPTITSGNAAPVSTEEFGPRGATWVDGLQLELFGRLLDGGTVVAEGVVAAAVIPG